MSFPRTSVLAFHLFGFLALAAPAIAGPGSEGEKEAALLKKAHALAQRFLIVDGHIDVPIRMVGKEEDISVRTPGGDFDYPRAVAGGLNSPFMSIYTPASYEKAGGSKDFALRLIEMVHGFEEAHPDKFRVTPRSPRSSAPRRMA